MTSTYLVHGVLLGMCQAITKIDTIIDSFYIVLDVEADKPLTVPQTRIEVKY